MAKRSENIGFALLGLSILVGAVVIVLAGVVVHTYVIVTVAKWMGWINV